MPTLTVSCAPLQPLERKRLALAFTRQLKQLGADTAHCMVFFNPLPEASVFSAGMPMPVADRDGAPAQFHVRITLSQARDRHAHQALAEGLHGCLRTQYPKAFIYLHFDPILPEHVFFSAGAELTNAAHQQGKTGS
ncbi:MULTISPECIES: hypothetical protein [Pseudomonas]|uniref:hypothetical protein n=1 Tax=Pseudomonas TaxID=286 RepID=UPI001F525C85|nr:hypothetical protein [Pseudomonas putida]MCI0911368.1 hypothetical protein [Pseudomonas putida]WAB95688.1 hypothetical protein OSW16_14005 [Pseudomonas putida]